MRNIRWIANGGGTPCALLFFQWSDLIADVGSRMCCLSSKLRLACQPSTTRKVPSDINESCCCMHWYLYWSPSHIWTKFAAWKRVSRHVRFCSGRSVQFRSVQSVYLAKKLYVRLCYSTFNDHRNTCIPSAMLFPSLINQAKPYTALKLDQAS